MDPEELYRLIEQKKELVIQKKSTEHYEELDPSQPTDIYQYLTDNQPIETAVEVTCDIEEAPDVPTLPSQRDIIFIIFVVIIVLGVVYFLKKINQRKNVPESDDLKSQLTSIIESDYENLIWTHHKIFLSKFELIIKKIETSTQRLYICDNNLEIVQIDELHRNVNQFLEVLKKLLDNEQSFAKISTRDDDEKLFQLLVSLQLSSFRKRLLECGKIIENFVSTRYYLMCDLNKARIDENREELLYCLSLCDRLDSNYLQQSRYIIQSHYLDAPTTNIIESNLMEPIGTFNFKLTEAYIEGKEFIKQYNEKEIQDRSQEIYDDVFRDVSHHQKIVQTITLQENQYLLNYETKSNPLLTYEHKEQSASTEQEGKVAIFPSHTSNNSLSIIESHRSQISNLSLVLMSSMGINEEKIKNEGEKRLKKEIREIQKEQKIDKNRADIRASDRFREIESRLKQGFHRDHTQPQQTPFDQLPEVKDLIKKRKASKIWQNRLMFLWFCLIGGFVSYSYCVGSVTPSIYELGLSHNIVYNPLDKYWTILQLRECSSVTDTAPPPPPTSKTSSSSSTLSFLSLFPTSPIDSIISLFSFRASLRWCISSIFQFISSFLFSSKTFQNEIMPILTPCVGNIIEIAFIPLLISIICLRFGWYRLSSLFAYGGILYSLRNVLLKYLSSSVYLGSILILLGIVYLVLETFDERLSWRTYIYIEGRKGKPVSIDWRIVIIFFILPTIFGVSSCVLGYVIAFTSHLP